MGRVLTNNTSLQYAIQQAFGTLGGSPSWKTVEPNGSITFGASTTSESRAPISKNRQRRKGSIVDLDSEVGYEADLTMDSLIDFAEGFCFATAVNADVNFIASNATGTADTFAVASLTAAQAAKLEVGTLLWAAGYVNGGNNGLHVISTDASATDTTLTVIASTLVTETAPANAEVTVAGFRGASGELSISVAAGVATITTTTVGLDYTAMGLTVGQFIHVGGVTSSNQFSAGAGFGRITGITATTITLDKLDAALATDTGTGEVVDLLWGRFIRNVPIDDSDFLERYFQFEAGFPNLFETTPPTPVANPDGFEYALDNACNQLEFNLPLTSLAKLTPGFIGTDTEAAVDNASRKTNASSPRDPLLTAALNTSADYARLRITDVDETGLTTDFKDWTLTLNNNAAGEKVQGFLGSKFINTGNFEVDISGSLLFTSELVTARIRAGTTVTMDFILENSDGAFAVDLPSMTLGDGSRDYAVNESLKINLTGEAFQDPTLGTSIGISLFPVTPASFAA